MTRADPASVPVYVRPPVLAGLPIPLLALGLALAGQVGLGSRSLPWAGGLLLVGGGLLIGGGGCGSRRPRV